MLLSKGWGRFICKILHCIYNYYSYYLYGLTVTKGTVIMVNVHVYIIVQLRLHKLCTVTRALRK